MVNTHVSVDKSILLLSFVSAYPALLKIINCGNIKSYNCTHPLLSGLINRCTEQILGSTRRFHCTFNEFEKQSLMKFRADNFVFSGGFEVFFSDKLINLEDCSRVGFRVSWSSWKDITAKQGRYT